MPVLEPVAEPVLETVRLAVTVTVAVEERLARVDSVLLFVLVLLALTDAVEDVERLPRTEMEAEFVPVGTPEAVLVGLWRTVTEPVPDPDAERVEDAERVPDFVEDRDMAPVGTAVEVREVLADTV